MNDEQKSMLETGSTVPKKKVGRPPENEEAFDANLHINCTRDEKNAWVRAAQESPERKLAPFVRRVLNEASNSD